MNTDSAALPQVVRKGVIFRLQVGAQERECLISKDALELLSGLKDTNPDPLEVFYAFQPVINEIASRRIRAGAREAQVVLGRESFDPDHPGRPAHQWVSRKGSGDI
jgi:hypothetical protein